MRLYEEDTKQYVVFEEVRRAKGRMIFRFELFQRHNETVRLRLTTLNMVHETHMFFAEEWCKEQFGPAGQRWKMTNGYRFIFRDECDAFAFKLRWC